MTNANSMKLAEVTFGSKPDHWRYRLQEVFWRPFWIISPTWGLATVLKSRDDRDRRAKVIKMLNWIYVLISITALFVAIGLTDDSLTFIRPISYCWWSIALQYILLSRFFEVAYAFLRDAYDKLDQPESSSELLWGDRVVLALRSYLELVSNFALIYALFPRSAWLRTDIPTPPDTITDLIWYSSNVITTSGGGGYYPADILLKFVSVCEVLSGIILVVVSFTIYTSRALGGKPKPKFSRDEDIF